MEPSDAVSSHMCTCFIPHVCRRACPNTTAVVHLDVDAPVLMGGLYAQVGGGCDLWWGVSLWGLR